MIYAYIKAPYCNYVLMMYKMYIQASPYNHVFLRKFSSMKKPFIYKTSLEIGLEVICCLRKIIIPPSDELRTFEKVRQIREFSIALKK